MLYRAIAISRLTCVAALHVELLSLLTCVNLQILTVHDLLIYAGQLPSGHDSILMCWPGPNLEPHGQELFLR